MLSQALYTHELEASAYDVKREKQKMRLDAAEAAAIAAREEASSARDALAEARAAAHVAATEADKKLGEAQLIIDSLRLSLGEAEAKLETSTLAAKATLEAELASVAAPVITAARELAASLGAQTAPLDDSGDADVATQLRGVATLGAAACASVPRYTLDCARASAELAFSCLSVVGCDHMAQFRADDFVVPGRSHISSARESVRDSSRSFLHRVWSELGPTHLRALQRSHRAREGHDAASGSAGAPGLERPAQVGP